MHHHPLVEKHKTDTRRALRRRWLAAGAAIAGCAALAAVTLLPAEPAAAPSPAGTASVVIRLAGVASEDGRIMAALCDRSHFLKQCAHTVTAAARPQQLLQFDGVPPGTYAVMLFHDENGNGAFDTSAGGMPLEGYGFSRNARGRQAAPGFDEAAVDVRPGMAALHIDMVY